MVWIQGGLPVNGDDSHSLIEDEFSSVLEQEPLQTHDGDKIWPSTVVLKLRLPVRSHFGLQVYHVKGLRIVCLPLRCVHYRRALPLFLLETFTVLSSIPLSHMLWKTSFRCHLAFTSGSSENVMVV